MNSRHTRLLTALPVLGTLCTPLYAQTIDLSPSVISGTYSLSSSFDQPFSVDSLNQAQIGEGQLGINASEALSRVPGLVIQNRQNYAQDLQISSRGFGARSAFGVRGIKLISDGIPASTPDGQGQAATFNLDTAERIEVLRGPTAAMYGSNAGGVIQVFSKDGQGTPTLGLESLIGSDDLYRHHLSAQGANQYAGFVLDASRMDTDGYRDHSAARRDQTFAKVHLHPDDQSKLALVFSSLEQNDTQDPLGQSWVGYKTDRRSVTDNALLYNTRKSIDHQQLGAVYERNIGSASLQSSLYVGQRQVIQYQAIPRMAQGAATHNGGIIDFSRHFYGASLRWLQPLGESWELAMGLDYDRSEDDRQGYENFDGALLGVKGALRRDEINTVTSLDPYLQGTWRHQQWTLQAGLRYSTVEIAVDDRYIRPGNGDDSGSRRFEQANPSFSIGYAFTPALNAYVSIGRGFETPTQGELSYAPSGASGSHLSLDPATSTQYELGIKARLAEHSLLNAAIFQIDTDDEIVVADSAGGRTSYQNAGRTQRRGLELSLNSQWNAHWSSSLAYTYLKAVYDADFIAGNSAIERGNQLPGVPRNTLFGELQWQPINGLSTALEGLYRSQVYVEDTNQQKSAPSYAIANWRARFEQKHGALTLHQTLRLDNLFDKKYIGSVIVGDSNGRYYEAAPGRSWYAGVGLNYAL